MLNDQVQLEVWGLYGKQVVLPLNIVVVNPSSTSLDATLGLSLLDSRIKVACWNPDDILIGHYLGITLRGAMPKSFFFGTKPLGLPVFGTELIQKGPVVGLALSDQCT